jgi:hypothetical protein
METRGMPMPEFWDGKYPYRGPWTWNLLVEEVERLRKMEREHLLCDDVDYKELDRRVKSLEDMHTFKPQPFHQPWIWPVPYYPYPYEITCATGPSK